MAGKRLYTSPEWRQLRLMVLSRDGFECQIRDDGCTGQASTVDHIIPVAEGGRHGLDNLRAACAKCNYSRGGKLGRQRTAAKMAAMEAEIMRLRRQVAELKPPAPDRPAVW